MKFAILGAGALGTILGAHLARAGHEVVMIARGERARTLQRQGLVLNGLSDLKARPNVIDDPRKMLATDTLIIATKAIDTAQAIDSLAHLRLDTALSVQNGVLKNELLARAFGYSRVLGAMADFSGELLANGEVKFTRNVCLHLGGERDGVARAAEIAGIIDAAGVRCQAVADIRTREWSKFAGWIAQFPLAVLTRQITWKFLMDERSALVIARIVRESAALAAAMKIDLVDMPPLPQHRTDLLRQVARAPHVGATGRAARQPSRIRGNAGLCAREGSRARRADADARCLLPHHRGRASLGAPGWSVRQVF
jgi:2-dehydropantoate 2-reductase